MTLKSSQRSYIDTATMFECADCGRSFNLRRELGNHKRVHRPKGYKCEKCGRTFSRKRHLQRHKLSHHKDTRVKKKIFPCEKCARIFQQSCHLGTHKRIHSEKRPFKCEKCGDRFKDKGHWERHKRIHVLKDILMNEPPAEGEIHVTEETELVTKQTRLMQIVEPEMFDVPMKEQFETRPAQDPESEPELVVCQSPTLAADTESTAARVRIWLRSPVAKRVNPNLAGDPSPSVLDGPGGPPHSRGLPSSSRPSTTVGQVGSTGQHNAIAYPDHVATTGSNDLSEPDLTETSDMFPPAGCARGIPAVTHSSGHAENPKRTKDTEGEIFHATETQDLGTLILPQTGSLPPPGLFDLTDELNLELPEIPAFGELVNGLNFGAHFEDEADPAHSLGLLDPTNHWNPACTATELPDLLDITDSLEHADADYENQPSAWDLHLNVKPSREADHDVLEHVRVSDQTNSLNTGAPLVEAVPFSGPTKRQRASDRKTPSRQPRKRRHVSENEATAGAGTQNRSKSLVVKQDLCPSAAPTVAWPVHRIRRVSTRPDARTLGPPAPGAEAPGEDATEGAADARPAGWDPRNDHSYAFTPGSVVSVLKPGELRSANTHAQTDQDESGGWTLVQEITNNEAAENVSLDNLSLTNLIPAFMRMLAQNGTTTLFLCDTCDRLFPTVLQKTLHQKDCSPVQNNPYHCHKCDKSFRSRREVASHARAVHPQPKPFVCIECGRAFSQRGQLIFHQRSHASPNRHVCGTCGKEFCGRFGLQVHCGRKHGQKLLSWPKDDVVSQRSSPLQQPPGEGWANMIVLFPTDVDLQGGEKVEKQSGSESTRTTESEKQGEELQGGVGAETLKEEFCEEHTDSTSVLVENPLQINAPGSQFQKVV